MRCQTSPVCSPKQTDRLAKGSDDAFVTKGFKNWKKAIEKFIEHERSQSHKFAVSKTLFKKNQESIEAEISKALYDDQLRARHVEDYFFFKILQ